MITPELAKAIDTEVAALDERITSLRTELEELETYRAAVEGFAKAHLNGSSTPPARPKQPKRRRSTTRAKRQATSKPSPRKPEPDPGRDAGRGDSIVDALAQRPGQWLSAGQIVGDTGLSKWAVKHSLLTLIEEGRVAKRGQRAGTRYRRADDSDPPPAAADDPPATGPDEVDRAERVSKGEERRRSVIALAEKHGTITIADVAEELDVPVPTARGVVRNMTSHGGPLRVSDEGQAGDPKRYELRSREIAPPDDSGARTEPERRVVEALQRAPVPLTSSELASNSGLNFVDASAIAAGLVRRGVLRSAPSASDTAPQRFEIRKAMAEAA